MCWAVWWCDSVLDLALSPALSLGGEWLGDLLGGVDGLLQLGGGEALLGVLGVAGDGLLRLGDLLGGVGGFLQLGDLLGGGEGLLWLDDATLPQPAPLSALAFLAAGLGMSLQGLLHPVLPAFHSLFLAIFSLSFQLSFLAILAFSMTPRYLFTSSSGTRFMKFLMS